MTKNQYRMLWSGISSSRKVRAVHGPREWRWGCHLLFSWLIAFADDEGRMRGESFRVMASVVPYEGMTIPEIEAMLAELHRVELILWYEVEGEKFIQIVNNDTFQRIRKDRQRASFFPPPQPDNQVATKCPQPDNHLTDTSRRVFGMGVFEAKNEVGDEVAPEKSGEAQGAVDNFSQGDRNGTSSNGESQMKSDSATTCQPSGNQMSAKCGHLTDTCPQPDNLSPSPSPSPSPSLKSIPHPPQSDGCGSRMRLYLTKRGKRLTGKLLEGFEAFWTAFDYRKGKAEAADAWLRLKPDPQLLAKIIEGAKKEAARRPAHVEAGHTPKWAQGWLSARRWEDEEVEAPSRVPQATRSGYGRHGTYRGRFPQPAGVPSDEAAREQAEINRRFLEARPQESEEKDLDGHAGGAPEGDYGESVEGAEGTLVP